MKKLLSVVSAVAGLALAGSAMAAPMGTLSVRLVPTAVVGTPGLFNVAVQVQVTGTLSDGAGGLSDMQFAITSDGSGLSDVLANGTGLQSGKAKITWDPAITSAFSLVAPVKTDLGSDGDADLNGAAFFDSNAFTNTALGLGGWQTIATTQWQIKAGQTADHLTVAASQLQWYDDVNGTAPNFRNTFATVDTSAGSHVLISVPEPASLGLLGLGVLGLAARRRQA